MEGGKKRGKRKYRDGGWNGVLKKGHRWDWGGTKLQATSHSVYNSSRQRSEEAWVVVVVVSSLKGWQIMGFSNSALSCGWHRVLRREGCRNSC
jgi:hypothetical protein